MPIERPPAVARRLERIEWGRVGEELDEQGWSCLPGLLSAAECHALVRKYGDEDAFRSTIDMERYRYGRGQYRYFAYPLPPIVDQLRRLSYVRLATVANRWMERMRQQIEYPAGLNEYLRACHAAGQKRPTPLLLRYGAGDYNCLHQDLYGALAFPLQIAVALSGQGTDYAGGEMIFHEQRPRAQSRASAVVPERGGAVVFANSERPARGARGDYRVQMRHGASVVRSGSRFVLGIIFHDAK
jgi:uncharacterized protein